MEQLGKEFQTYGANAHDAIHIIAKAIKMAGTDNPKAVRDALENVKYRGLVGDFSVTLTDHYGMPVEAVVPHADHVPEHTRNILTMASDIVQEKGFAKSGDRIIVVSGRPLLGPDRTNSIVIHTVGETY